MLSIIIVNYKSEDRTISFIKKEIIPKINIPYKVIIVNNSATDESNNLLEKRLGAKLIYDINIPLINSDNIYIIPHKDNLGFAKGNNLGAKFATMHLNTKHFLFTNNDICLITNDVIEKLIKKIDSLSDIGLIGPKVIGLKNETQSPEPFVSFWNRYFWIYWLTPFLNKKQKGRIFKLNYSETAIEGVHYKIMGSFFLMKHQDFIDCGMMDENTFLYAEEVILSERLKSIGKNCYYYPSVSVLHDHGYTTSNSFSKAKIYKLKFESEAYYYRRYKDVSSLSIKIGKLSLDLYLKLKAKI